MSTISHDQRDQAIRTLVDLGADSSARSLIRAAIRTIEGYAYQEGTVGGGLDDRHPAEAQGLINGIVWKTERVCWVDLEEGDVYSPINAEGKPSAIWRKVGRRLDQPLDATEVERVSIVG